MRTTERRSFIDEELVSELEIRMSHYIEDHPFGFDVLKLTT